MYVLGQAQQNAAEICWIGASGSTIDSIAWDTDPKDNVGTDGYGAGEPNVDDDPGNPDVCLAFSLFTVDTVTEWKWNAKRCNSNANTSKMCERS